MGNLERIPAALLCIHYTIIIIPILVMVYIGLVWCVSLLHLCVCVCVCTNVLLVIMFHDDGSTNNENNNDLSIRQ